MFKVEYGANTKSGLVIDLGGAYRGDRHLRIYPKNKEACVEALKHWLAMAHDKEICASCDSPDEPKGESTC